MPSTWTQRHWKQNQLQNKVTHPPRHTHATPHNQRNHARARWHTPRSPLPPPKVTHLESSAEADAKVLLEARNKIDEVQRRLKAEKGEHVTTAGLLEEERARSA